MPNRRFLISVFAASFAFLAGAADAGTSLLGAGQTNWFYACGGGRVMNIVVRHTDRTVTRLSLARGQRLRGFVRRGDVEAWRCGGPVPAGARYLAIVTLPTLN